MDSVIQFNERKAYACLLFGFSNKIFLICADVNYAASFLFHNAPWPRYV